MSEEHKTNWSEVDVQALIGQSETIRREFKAGVMFDREEEEGKWTAELSKQVSAFANSEGGELILGIQEDKKSKPRVATAVDGVPVRIGPETLQRKIEGNVSPYLPGIRVQRVALSARPDRVVFVVQVPKGSTAYQASPDRRYYGRSEYEVIALPDHEVRLRMSRGKVARAAVYLRLRGVALGAGYEKELRAKHADAIEAFKASRRDAVRGHAEEVVELLEARFRRDEVAFDLVFRNEGELTIRDPAVEIHTQLSQPLSDGWTLEGAPLPPRLEMRGDVIYPGDEREIKGSERQLRCKREAVLVTGDYGIRWKVFLDNSPPSEGEIDVATELQKAREGDRD